MSEHRSAVRREERSEFSDARGPRETVQRFRGVHVRSRELRTASKVK